VERATGFKLNALRVIVIALFATLCYESGWTRGHESAISQLFLPPTSPVPSPDEADLRRQEIARQGAQAGDPHIAMSQDCTHDECAANDDRPADGTATP
jgi:hypothetical protein